MPQSCGGGRVLFPFGVFISVGLTGGHTGGHGRRLPGTAVRELGEEPVIKGAASREVEGREGGAGRSLGGWKGDTVGVWGWGWGWGRGRGSAD